MGVRVSGFGEGNEKYGKENGKCYFVIGYILYRCYVGLPGDIIPILENQLENNMETGIVL